MALPNAKDFDDLRDFADNVEQQVVRLGEADSTNHIDAWAVNLRANAFAPTSGEWASKVTASSRSS